MVVAALFQGGNLQFNGFDFWGDFSVTDGADGQFAVPGHRGDFFILQVHHILGVRDDGRGIRSHKKVVVAPHTDHKWTGFAGCDQAVWVGFVEYHNGVSSVHFFQRDAHGVGKVEPCGGHDLLDEMRQHLRVGVADQGVTSVRQQFFQRLIILNDAVVNDRDFSFAAHVRVGVAVAGWAMGGPTGVSDADGANWDVLSHMRL